MLIQAMTTAAGPGANAVFEGLPTPSGFAERQHLREGEIFDVSASIGKSKVAMRSGGEEAAFPVFREVSRKEAEEFGFEA